LLERGDEEMYDLDRGEHSEASMRTLILTVALL
jgi:hypothetical protein